MEIQRGKKKRIIRAEINLQTNGIRVKFMLNEFDLERF